MIDFLVIFYEHSWLPGIPAIAGVTPGASFPTIAGVPAIAGITTGASIPTIAGIPAIASVAAVLIFLALPKLLRCAAACVSAVTSRDVPAVIAFPSCQVSLLLLVSLLWPCCYWRLYCCWRPRCYSLPFFFICLFFSWWTQLFSLCPCTSSEE